MVCNKSWKNKCHGSGKVAAGGQRPGSYCNALPQPRSLKEPIIGGGVGPRDAAGVKSARKYSIRIEKVRKRKLSKLTKCLGILRKIL